MCACVGGGGGKEGGGDKEGKRGKNVNGKSLVKCHVYMFGFMFIMPAKLSVYLPLATVITVVSRCNMLTFSSAE